MEKPPEIEDHPKTRKNPRPMANGYQSSDHGQRAVDTHGCEADSRMDILDLVEGLVDRLQNRPQCFHLEWPPGVSPPDDVVRWIVRCAVGWWGTTSLDGTRPSGVNNVRLTECHCDLSGGNESDDRWHVMYQEACWRVAKAHVSRFKELFQSGTADNDTPGQLGASFLSLTDSALLKHCRVDMELVLLCGTFFELAKGCLIMRIHSDEGKVARGNMLKWFEVSILSPGISSLLL